MRMASVTRFQVMAVLQAARARALGLSSEEAKSFGVNRALFYAAAKRGWANAKALGMPRPVIAELEQDRQAREQEHEIGGEKVFGYRDSEGGALRFQFGGRAQLPREFDRKVRDRIPDFPAAWQEAVRIIKAAP